MPLYRTGSQLLFYAHVPKCAGSTVNTYLRARFGDPAFEDRKHIKNPERPAWSRTSPQHIPARNLARLMPAGFADLQFAIVRHPEARIQSVYDFQRRKQKRIPRAVPFGAWLRAIPALLAARPFALDGHARPMTDFVPDGCRFFRLEDGLEPVIGYLDGALGTTSDAVPGHEKRGAPRSDLTPSQRRLVRRIYAGDYAAFGYE